MVSRDEHLEGLIGKIVKSVKIDVKETTIYFTDGTMLIIEPQGYESKDAELIVTMTEIRAVKLT